MTSTAKPLCVLPFIHAYLDAQDVLTPCCAYNAHPSNYEQRPITDFDSWWDSGLTQLRADMLTGTQHKNCSKCWNEEAQGITSYRQHQNKRWEHYSDITEPLPVPVVQMIAPGNFCNLKCIMCSPHLSSAWGIEYERNRDKFKSIGIDYNSYSRGFWKNRSSAAEVLERIVPHAESLHIMGGEPLLNPDCLRVLKSVENPADVELIINTNLTSLTEEWIEIFLKFNSTVLVSVEGTGEKNDYIRAGSDWNTIEANIQRLRAAGVVLHLTTTFSRVSLSSYPDLLQYSIDQGIPLHTNLLFWPESLQLRGAPQTERDYFLNAIKEIDISKADIRPSSLDVFINEVNTAEYSEHVDNEFRKYIAVIDQVYGKDYHEIFYAKA
jgi:sulfatase maturation enzyme AslB (radical SAM superfamily)